LAAAPPQAPAPAACSAAPRLQQSAVAQTRWSLTCTVEQPWRALSAALLNVCEQNVRRSSKLGYVVSRAERKPLLCAPVRPPA